MNREVSAYLDCARLLCALLVLFAHVELNWVPGVWRFFIPLGNESLAVLFVLSGFVIGYVSDSRETTLQSYLVHRAARVYSVLIPCVFVGFCLDTIGKHFMTHYYLAGSWPPLGGKLYQFQLSLFSLTFLGEAWGGDLFPGSMAPYWTLPYEVAYYLVFGTAWYLRGWRRLLAPMLIALVAGPQVMIFLPLWLIGMLSYRLCNWLHLGKAAGRAMFFGGLLALLLGEAVAIAFKFDFGFGAQESPELWPFYIAGSLFAVITLGFRFGGFSISRYTGWARWGAGASATLYLLHFPAGRFFNGLIPFDWSPIARWPLVVSFTIAASLLVAAFSERRKEAWRRKIEAGIKAIAGFSAGRKLLPQENP